MATSSFLILAGIVGIGDGLDMPVPRGRIYFALGFSVTLKPGMREMQFPAVKWHKLIHDVKSNANRARVTTSLGLAGLEYCGLGYQSRGVSHHDIPMLRPQELPSPDGIPLLPGVQIGVPDHQCHLSTNKTAQTYNNLITSGFLKNSKQKKALLLAGLVSNVPPDCRR